MDRLLAAGLALLAGASVLGQVFGPFPGAPADAAGRIWLMAGLFTILTNLLICGTMLARAAGARVAARWALALLVSILVVSAVDHTLLAPLWAPEGFAWWANQGLHSAVPVFYALWWLDYADKRLGRGALGTCLAWPLVYCGYALTRGALTGFWPYPFLDAGALGWARVGLNIVGLVAVFVALSSALIALARRLSR